MYWLRITNIVDLALFFLLCGAWALGGWLLVTHAFHLRPIERILAGSATGFLLFITISNLLAHVFPLTAAFWGASVLILLAGIVSAWHQKLRDWLSLRDLRAIFLFAGLAGITLLFTLILRGEAIFDEYVHIPLISIMAAGDIPPHFYLNPGFYFAYHYGIQVFAASLVRLAGFFPWSAWDISRALAIAFTLVLGWLWVQRVTRSKLAAFFGTILCTLGGGTRWLLLLLPASWLDWLSRSVNLIGSGLSTAPTLAEALHKNWVIEGAGPIAFPFAFHNGIFVPVFFTLGGNGAMPFMTVLLLLLLLPRGRFSWAGMIVWTLIFTSLALSAEHLFAVIWAGVAMALIITIMVRKRLTNALPRLVFIQWGCILFLSGVLALVQGGFITETARNLIDSILGVAAQSYNAGRFSLRWPPSLLSAHLGSLSIFNPGQLITLLAELGPALLVIPVIFVYYKRKFARKDIFSTGLAISAGISLIFPFFFQYEVDRDLTRMSSTGLWTILVMGFPILWIAIPHINALKRLGLVMGYFALVLAGIVIFRTQIDSLKSAQYTYYIDGLDAGYAVDYWNKLPPGTQVLDRIPERSVAIFGRISRSNSGIYDPLPEWQALVAAPDPRLAAAEGYNYIYMDNIWWQSLSPSQRANFQQPCTDIISEREQDQGTNYRILIDINACK